MLGYSLLQEKYPLNKILFFDIETTGLSSNMSYLYLIGCIYYKDNKPILLQWFSEGIEEEKELLKMFFAFLKNFNVLIHYNGSGFDIPYLLKKCKRYLLPYDFDHVTSIDIYKELTQYKKYLPLSSLKQRSVEEFLHITRIDPFTGGDLIEVYTKYVGTKRYETLKSSSLHKEYEIITDSGLPSLSANKSDALLSTLLLHNAEDLKGLLAISSMLSYVDLFRGNIKEISLDFTKSGLNIWFTLPSPLPRDIQLSKILINNENPTSDEAYEITCSVSGTKGHCYLPFYYGELKHFFPNYKEYYYLPVEDTAIHKSVAEYVDKDFRKKATKETCYIKKTGLFLPQVEILFTPEFQFTCKDKLLWYDATQLKSDQYSNKPDILKMYLHQVILLMNIT